MKTAALKSVLLALAFAAAAFAQDEVSKATDAAIRFAARSVVQIDTVGGLTPQGQIRSTAPFSGTVVSRDGLILTASYNLLHQPASIFVKLPGAADESDRFSAEVIATDSSRNLTLLKIERADLIPIRFAPGEDLRTGERAIAVGKSISVRDPNVSLGIVSAQGRIWGRATQTDAKISRLNYGGPLIRLTGEAIGILVPMQHSSPEVAAGSQWYDSGIGFAASVDPESAAFKRMLGGESLRAGLMGVSFAGQDENADPAKVSFCLPTSPGGKAGLRVGDTIVEAGGVKILRQGQFRHVIGPLYENETLAIKVRREDRVLEFKVELSGEIEPYVEPELGLLLSLTQEAPVVEALIPDSPASGSGLQKGDQLLKLGGTAVKSVADFRREASLLLPGEPCSLSLDRGGQVMKVTITPRRQLANLLINPPRRSADDEGTRGGAVEAIEIKVAEASNKCIAIVPAALPAEDGAPQSRRPVLVWVPQPGPWSRESMLARFKSFCGTGKAIVLVPQSVDPDKWLDDDSSVIARAVERLAQRLAVDSNRVAIAGKGAGGEMALLTAFSNRNVFRGVAVVDAELSTTLPNTQSLPSKRLHMLVLGGEDHADRLQFFHDKGFSIFSDDDSSKPIKSLFGWIKTLDRL